MVEATITVSCNGCGKKFVTLKHKARRCCSAECMAKVLRERNMARAKPRIKVCKVCGGKFTVFRQKNRQALCCSKECSAKARAAGISAAAKAKPPRPMLIKTCPECNKDFSVPRSLPNKVLCSTECRIAHRSKISSRTFKRLHAERPEFKARAKEALRARLKELWQDPDWSAAASQRSSERMKRRRNGGDPALNAILAKACGEHFKRLWADPAFREKTIERGKRQLDAYNNSDAHLERDAKNRKLFKKAASKLRNDTDYLILLGETLSEYRAQYPFDRSTTMDYMAYQSELMTMVHSDTKLRAFTDAKMSAIFTALYAARRSEQAAE